jgi:U3 small nucleolar RNA-associated protein 12
MWIQKFVAVSLIDNTVRIYFADTMKFYLALYGHKVGWLVGDWLFGKRVLNLL